MDALTIKKDIIKALFFNYIYIFINLNNQAMDFEVKDSNGALLSDGDSVQLTRDLKVKGSSTNLKRGTVIKNIRLSNDSNAIECRIGKSTIVLKTEYLKKKG